MRIGQSPDAPGVASTTSAATCRATASAPARTAPCPARSPPVTRRRGLPSRWVLRVPEARKLTFFLGFPAPVLRVVLALDMALRGGK